MKQAESREVANPSRIIGSSRQKFLKNSVTAGVALAICPKSRAAEGSSPDPFPHEGKSVRIGKGNRCVLRFAHITDSHYYVINETQPNYAAFKKYMKSRTGWHTEKPAADVYQELQRRKVKLAIHTGDIIDYSTDENRKFFERMCSDIPFPVHYCLGNHDYQTLKIDSNAKAKWGYSNEANNIVAWKKQVGLFTDRNYTFIRNGYRFICLDNALRKFDAKQMTWLNTLLSSSVKMPCILCFHIPLYSKHMEDVTKNKKALMPAEGEIYNLLASHNNVAAIFAGHVHQNIESKINGIPQYTTKPTFQRSFRVVECYG